MTVVRRFLSGIALCLSGILATHQGSAQVPIPSAPPGARFLLQNEGPVPGYVTILLEFTLEPNAVVGEHSHPGIHGVYLIEGGGELVMGNQKPRRIGAGEAVQFGVGNLHSFKNGPTPTRGIATYVIEQGKPLVSAF